MLQPESARTNMLSMPTKKAAKTAVKKAIAKGVKKEAATAMTESGDRIQIGGPGKQGGPRYKPAKKAVKKAAKKATKKAVKKAAKKS